MQKLLGLSEQTIVVKSLYDVTDRPAAVAGYQLEHASGCGSEQSDPQIGVQKIVAMSVDLSKLAISFVADSTSSIFSWS